MHFALPPRKTAIPSPYSLRNGKSPLIRRTRFLHLLVLLAGISLLGFILVRVLSGGDRSEEIPAGTPPVVLVTVVDRTLGDDHVNMIMENRIKYAGLHNYATFFANATDYNLGDFQSPPSWAKLPTMRHAMAVYPHSSFFFYLGQDALIVNPTLTIHDHIMNPTRLESILLIDKPIVPPDSIIRTFRHAYGGNIDLVITQDSEGLSQESFIVRRGDWARFFLDVWFDPLYRSYNFQRAEAHALEHLVQWHGTVLSKLALVPQKLMNAYPEAKGDSAYADGDFVVHLKDCGKRGSCQKDMRPFFAKFKALVGMNKP